MISVIGSSLSVDMMLIRLKRDQRITYGIQSGLLADQKLATTVKISSASFALIYIANT